MSTALEVVPPQTLGDPRDDLTDDTAAAERGIRAAWASYRSVERTGLEFGRVCYEWQQKFTKQGSRDGLGLRPILDKVEIPHSTAYFWIKKYKTANGITEPIVAKPVAPLAERIQKKLTPLLPVGHDGALELQSLFEEFLRAPAPAGPAEREQRLDVIFLYRKIAEHFVECADKLEAQR